MILYSRFGTFTFFTPMKRYENLINLTVQCFDKSFAKIYGMEMDEIYWGAIHRPIDSDIPYKCMVYKFPNKMFIRSAEIINVRCKQADQTFF